MGLAALRRVPFLNPYISSSIFHAKHRLSAQLALRILPQPCGESSLVERARCQSHDGLGSVCLASLEVEAVEFQEENANHKSRPLIAIDERMIADNASCIQRSHF